MARTLCCGEFTLPLDRPKVMGIVNLTRDSFSGDGLADDFDAAVRHAFHQIESGADILDIGAESSRPGALSLPPDEEKTRIREMLLELRGCGVPVSVDTYRPDVMRVALDHGASMINDIRALLEEGAIEAAAGSGCAVCLMHMQGKPATMQDSPEYDNVVSRVARFIENRVEAAISGGIPENRLVVDPGFGFGKTLAHNIELMKNLNALSSDLPVLVGVSRKSMLGAIVGAARPPSERVSASVAAALVAVQRGADIVRVHDVAQTRDALAVLAALGG